MKCFYYYFANGVGHTPLSDYLMTIALVATASAQVSAIASTTGLDAASKALAISDVILRLPHSVRRILR